MAAKLKAHTAQQRFSAGLLCVLPIVVGLGFWILKPEYIRLLWTDPGGQQVLHLRDHLRDRRHPGDPQDRQHQGMRTMLTNLLFFLLTGATLDRAAVDWHRAVPARRRTRWATAWKNCSRKRMVVAAAHSAPQDRPRLRPLPRTSSASVPGRRRLDARHREAAEPGRHSPQECAGHLYASSPCCSCVLLLGRHAVAAARQSQRPRC